MKIKFKIVDQSTIHNNFPYKKYEIDFHFFEINKSFTHSRKGNPLVLQTHK
jgi:hypothetical protein